MQHPLLGQICLNIYVISHLLFDIAIKFYWVRFTVLRTTATAQLLAFKKLLNKLLLETEWSGVILIWLFVSIKFTRSFLKLSFLISLFKRFSLQFASTNITFFLRFFQSERRHLVFSFAHFLNKIVKPKRETPFSKLLKGYICYEFPK